MSKTARRRASLVLGGLLLSLALVVAACSSDNGSSSSGGSGGGSKGSLIVGSKDVIGAQILSQAYGQALEASGYHITFKDNIGRTEAVYPLLEQGDIDLYGEFGGTWLQYRGGVPSADSTTTFRAIEDELKGSNVVAVGPASARDVNAFYVLRKTAQKFNLRNVSDLKAIAPQLVFGGPPECLDRPLCLGDKSEQLYGLQFKEVKKLDAGSVLTNQALDDGTVDVAELFTGSSVIKPDYVMLRDDKGLQPADNPIALITKDRATAELIAVIKSVNAKLDSKAYREMSLQVLNDKEDPSVVVKQWLKDNKLT
jgi:osmoprotectant transport system substrate-binding protein